MNTVKIVITFFCLVYFLHSAFGQFDFGISKLNKEGTTRSIAGCQHSPADFKVDFDVCNIYQVDFSNNSLYSTAFSWDFGDGSTGAGNDDISHVYNAEGIYSVMLVAKNNNGCLDTISKKFILDIDRGNIFSNKNLSVCSGDTIQLPGDREAIKNCWSPAQYLNHDDIYDPLCSPVMDIRYQYNILKKGSNLVSNGNFSNGDAGFSSEYIYDSVVNTNGHYFVSSEPKQWDSSYENCFMDSMNSVDSMMIIKGSTKSNLIVWQSDMAVKPNTNYAFGFFAQSLTIAKSIILQVSINGGEIIGQVKIPDTTCKSKKFNTTWFSAANTTVSITITDMDTGSTKNNFGLDSISLKPIYLKTDSIVVSIKPAPVFNIQPSPSTICSGDSVVLSASGGDIYAWYPPETSTAANSPTARVFPSSNTLYKIIITESTCNITDSVFAMVFVNPKPVVSVSKTNDVDCSIVQSGLNATGGISYYWQPENTLSNAFIANPIAIPSTTTTYHVQVTGENLCVTEDTIQVKVNPDTGVNLFLIPNAFTPNNDGVNDCFSLHKWGYIIGIQFLIYNRWGQLLFSATDTGACWDGKYKGVPQDSGAYVYLVKGKTICGDIIRKGTITLIR